MPLDRSAPIDDRSARGASPQVTRQPGLAAAPRTDMEPERTVSDRGSAASHRPHSLIRGTRRTRRDAAGESERPGCRGAAGLVSRSRERAKRFDSARRQGARSGRAPALIPSKPPIRDEDGLVEVGWEGDLEDELSAPETRADGSCEHPVRTIRRSNEELIEDRYAALQAISERTRNEAG